MLSETSGDFADPSQQPTVGTLASSIGKTRSDLIILIIRPLIDAWLESVNRIDSYAVEPTSRFRSIASAVLYRIAHAARKSVVTGIWAALSAPEALTSGVKISDSRDGQF